MKHILSLFILFLGLNFYGFAQCNCQDIIKENGAKVTQCSPLPIAADNDMQIAVSGGKFGSQKYIALTIRFRNEGKEVDGKFTIWLMDGNSIDLYYQNGGLVYVGNSQVAQALFYVEKSQINKIKKSNIKTVSFTFKDGLRRIYTAKQNSDILRNHFDCL
jgi:hypothetical protein